LAQYVDAVWGPVHPVCQWDVPYDQTGRWAKIIGYKYVRHTGLALNRHAKYTGVQ